MRAVDIIIKVRDRVELTPAEIQFFVNGIADGSIPDYQVAAWAMAVLLNGLTPRETTDLTLAMAHSGEVLDLSAYVPLAVDKHSTGGVGDKVTMVVEPIVAACGLPVAKMSGRGLGFSGGTLDKLESIPGYRTDLTRDEFIEQLKAIGIVLTGQTGTLAPADGKLYALRDVTGTVPSTPLIAASVMGKKIAAGAQAIVLDVKVGNGAFMTNLADARELSRLMVEIGRLSGRQVTALLSDMNQPLGAAVGNALEVKEALEALHGKGPADLLEHCLTVAAHMLTLGKKARNLDEGQKLAQEMITSGKAFETFRKLVNAQGGDVSYLDHPESFPVAPVIVDVFAEQSGFIAEFNARVVGETSVELGAGRAKKTDQIDHSVGFLIHKKVGDSVRPGDILFTIHAASQEAAENARGRVLSGIKMSKEKVAPLPLFYGVVQ
jgi:pyrimidine-nucleoside phosphorylase